MKSKPIYVERLIRAELDELWTYTQTPELHQQWDLRFSEIRYLARESAAAPQRFLYKTNIAFGLSVSGEGETVSVFESDAAKTSVLKFWSDNPFSLIRDGAGLWKYVPTDGGIRFFTRYDYDTRFGAAGKLFDRWCFRPLMGWATAWSFDALGLWLENGTHPRTSLLRSMTELLCRMSLALIWLYQGLFPKLLYPDSGELSIVQSSGLFDGRELELLHAIGFGEMAFGLALLFSVKSRRRALYKVNIAFLLLLGAGALAQPHVYIEPFNPASLNIAMIALAAAGLLQLPGMPDAAACLRKPANQRQ